MTTKLWDRHIGSTQTLKRFTDSPYQQHNVNTENWQILKMCFVLRQECDLFRPIMLLHSLLLWDLRPVWHSASMSQTALLLLNPPYCLRLNALTGSARTYNWKCKYRKNNIFYNLEVFRFDAGDIVRLVVRMRIWKGLNVVNKAPKRRDYLRRLARPLFLCCCFFPVSQRQIHDSPSIFEY